jgi:DNA polymerase-3 subunit epsilon
MREICLDTETTGLDPKDGHKVIEIACVELVNKVKTGNFFHTYVNPRRDVPQEATKVHGITTEFLQDKPIFDHIAHKFLDFIKDTKIIIHNAAFDTKFLNHELRILGLNSLDSSNIIDSLAIARNKFPGSPNSLDALCRRFGIDLSKRVKHGALLDTELLADVYIELMGGAQGGFNFDASKAEVKAAMQDEVFEVVRRKIAKRDFSLSDEELMAHKAFIEKNIKNNLWYLQAS